MLLVCGRLGFGLLGFAALVTEVAVLAERGTLRPGRLFAFSTIQSNVIASLVLIVGAVMVVHPAPPRWGDHVRGAATTSIAITGVVFTVALASIDDVESTAVSWDNFVLHYLIPVVAVVDWLVDPPSRPIAFRAALPWLIYPVVYAVCSLIRGCDRWLVPVSVPRPG